MFSLLNRFAWVVSWILGLLTSMLLFGIFDADIFDEDIILWVYFLLSPIFGVIWKGALLSDTYITEALKKNESIHRDTSLSVPPVSEIQKILDETSEAPVQESIYTSEESVTTTPVDIAAPAEPGLIQRFFAENAIAKIGGILLFLAVVFFLSLIYSSLGNVGRSLVGVLVAAIFYGVGIFLDKKGLIGESRTLLGIAVLSLYAVILTARHLLGSPEAPFLSEGITLVFLILTTLFAIFTGLVYRSHIFVAFSFAAAYVVPFLVGSSADSPYGLLLYTLVISLGGFVLALWYDEMSIVKRLIRISVIAGIALAVVASLTVKTPLHFIAVALTIVITTSAAYFSTLRRGHLREMLTVFIAGFVGILLTLVIGSTLPVFALGSISILGAILFSPLLFLIGLWYILRRLTLPSIQWLLFAPLVLFLTLLLTPLGDVFFSAILICALISFAVVILVLAHTFSALFQSLFFGGFTLFLLFSSLIFRFSSVTDGAVSLPLPSFACVVISLLSFFVLASYTAYRKNISELVLISTLGVIFALFPIIHTSGEVMILSILAILGFALIHFISLLGWIKNHSTSGVLIYTSIIAALLFFSIELFFFGQKYFPGVSLGLAFFALALVYSAYGLVWAKLSGILEKNIDIEKTPSVDGILTIFGGVLSLVTLSIALVFSQYSGIIAAAWIFESTLLIALFSKYRDVRIYVAALILMAIGAIRVLALFGDVQVGEYFFLIPVATIFASLALSLCFLREATVPLRRAHDILHTVLIISIGMLVADIVPQRGLGWSIFSLALFSVALLPLYIRWGSEFLRWFFVLFLAYVCVDQITSLSSIFYRIDNGVTVWKNETEGFVTQEVSPWLRLLQYSASAILLSGITFFARAMRSQVAAASWILVSAFGLIITSQYVWDFFLNTFALTMWWTAIAAVLLITGIEKYIPRFRTLGLYLGVGILAKILLYDVWVSFDDAIARVLALMITGIIMIVISSLYRKRLGGDMTGEFSIQRILDSEEYRETK